MIANFTQNRALTAVSRTRLLPIWGKILVRTGQEVEADDNLAIANAHPQHHLINIAHSLNCSVEESESYLKRKIGEIIKEGSILAETKNSKRSVRSPAIGTILSFENGIVLLQSNTKVYQLKAGFPGTVTKVIGNEGVIVESTGLYAQGAWSNGLEGGGSLTTFSDSIDESLSMDNLKAQHNDIVSVAAWCDDPKVFEHALENNWKGMIFGSLPSNLIPQVSELSFPVLLTEGFGKTSINSYTADLLNSQIGRNISIGVNDNRPDLFIAPADKTDQPDSLDEQSTLEIGTKVRILKGKYFGITGTIVENNIIENNQYPNQVRSKSIMIKLPDDEKVVFPLANIDVFM